MTKFYFVPGLGCDRRIFQNCIALLEIKDHQIHHLEWCEPLHTKESIVDYAIRIAQDIPKDGNTIFIGLSLGGMVATELAKIIPNKQLFIISSIKHESERPSLLEICKILPVYRLVPTWVTKELAPRFARWLGITKKDSSLLFADMLKKMPPNHIRWARYAAVNWLNKEAPQNCIHIHGTHDHIFTKKPINVDYMIPKGTHGMITDRSEEIAKIINQEIKKILR